MYIKYDSVYASAVCGVVVLQDMSGVRITSITRLGDWSRRMCDVPVCTNVHSY